MSQEYCPYCMSPVEPERPCAACGLTAGTYTPSAHHLPPGTVLRDRYLVGRVLGEGGFGITYIGCDLQLELKVAIKEYFPTDRSNRVASASLEVSSYTGSAGAGFESGKERFLKEARTMALLDKQPVIVTVRDFFRENNTAYIVMEYVEGTTLKDLTAQRGGRMGAGELLHMIEPLFAALSGMHRKGLIHRDISPENLMLEGGNIRLLDFGCARESSSGDSTLTIMLKHGFAPVEQYQSKGQGPWTDVYALAATIYYCLTGVKPPQAMDRLVEDELAPPRKLGAELTQDQERALLRGMGVRPKKRYQSMEEFFTGLYEGEDPIPVPPPPPPPPPKPNPKPDPPPPLPEPDRKEKLVKFVADYRIQLVAGAGALVLALALLIWQPWRQGGVTPEPAPGSSTVGVPESSTMSAPESSESDSESGGNESAEVDFANAAKAKNEGQLRTLMADDTVAAVRIDDYGPLFINEPIEVTKPLLVKGRLYLRAPFVMIGAQLRVEGPVYGSAMMRTMDGGSITVAGEGVILADGLIWTEDPEDLRYEDGAVEYSGRHITLDEEELFKDAQRVGSFEEFETACHTKKPIIIEKGFRVNRGVLLSPQSDVLIEEGAQVTLEWSDTLEMRGHVLINRGALAGRLHMMDSSSPSTLINYGALDTAVSLSGGGAAVNIGQWNVRSADINDPFTVINGGRGALTLTEEPEADCSYITMDTNSMFNFGEISLGGLERRSSISLSGLSFFNGGSITIGDNASLVNSGQLINCGSITAKKGGELMNFAFIETSGENGLLDLADDTWQGEGIVTYKDNTQLRISQEESGRHQGGRAAMAYGDANYEDERRVANGQELREALSDPEVVRVRTDAPITVEGDLEVKNKILAPEAGLTVKGTVRVSGNQGLVWMSNGGLEAESLVIEDRAMGIFFDSFSPGSVTLQSGGRMYTHGYGNEYAYDLRNSGGIAIYGGTQSFSGSGFTLEEGGHLRLTGRLELMGCGVSIGEDCQFVTDSGELVTDSGCTVANDGEMNIGGWGWKERVLCGQIENRGVMSLGPNVALGDGSGGGFVNRGSLILQGDPNAPAVLRMALENLGTVSDPGGGGIRIEDGGSASGVPQEFIR